MERPALQKLLDDVRARKIAVIVVYKVDRLTRSLADFAKLVELFDAHGVSFISVTQAFNTTTSMGRLTLNMLLSFAQFEREITGERIRDEVAASKRKGIWMGGAVPLGYRVEDRALHVVEQEAEFVRSLFRRYLEVGSVVRLKTALDAENIRSPVRISGTGKRTGGVPISRGHLYWILSNPIYVVSPPPAGCRTRRGPRSPVCASAATPSGLIGPTRREDQSIGSTRRRWATIASRRTLRRRRPAKRRRIGPSGPRACELVGRRDGGAPKSERPWRGIGPARAVGVRARNDRCLGREPFRPQRGSAPPPVA